MSEWVSSQTNPPSCFHCAKIYSLVNSSLYYCISFDAAVLCWKHHKHTHTHSNIIVILNLITKPQRRSGKRIKFHHENRLSFFFLFLHSSLKSQAQTFLCNPVLHFVYTISHNFALVSIQFLSPSSSSSQSWDRDHIQLSNICMPSPERDLKSAR